MTVHQELEAIVSKSHRVVLASYVIVCTLLIGLIAFVPWVTWVRFALAMVLAVTGVILAFALRWPGTPMQPDTIVAYPAALPSEHNQESVTGVLLPSRCDDYYFLFSATVLWSRLPVLTNGSLINMGALAVDAVLKRACEVTKQRDPSHASLVQHELAGILAEMRKDAAGRLQAMAESVQLAVPDHDQQRLDKLAAVRKEEAIWQHERKYEQSRREYLGEDVLKDPGSAVVWWLAKNDDQVEKTVQDIGLLAQLSSAARNAEIPAVFHQLVAGFPSGYAPRSPSPDLDGSSDLEPDETGGTAADYFDAFLHAMDMTDGNPERILFARQVADLAATHGRQEVADEIMNRFDELNDAEHPLSSEDETGEPADQ
jgi:hypothetical protein